MTFSRAYIAKVKWPSAPQSVINPCSYEVELCLSDGEPSTILEPFQTVINVAIVVGTEANMLAAQIVWQIRIQFEIMMYRDRLTTLCLLKPALAHFNRKRWWCHYALVLCECTIMFAKTTIVHPVLFFVTCQQKGRHKICVLRDLQPSSEYTVRVRAVNARGRSAFSHPKQFRTMDLPSAGKGGTGPLGTVSGMSRS